MTRGAPARSAQGLTDGRGSVQEPASARGAPMSSEKVTVGTPVLCIQCPLPARLCYTIFSSSFLKFVIKHPEREICHLRHVQVDSEGTAPPRVAQPPPPSPSCEPKRHYAPHSQPCVPFNILNEKKMRLSWGQPGFLKIFLGLLGSKDSKVSLAEQRTVFLSESLTEISSTGLSGATVTKPPITRFSLPCSESLPGRKSLD